MLPFWNREAIEIEVVNMLEDYLGEVVYPLDVDMLAAKMGIKVSPYPSRDTYEGHQALYASPDAFSLCNPTCDFATIYFNPFSYSETRIKFSKGHEIAHIYLEHIDLNDPRVEDEADYFSGYLLAPHPLIDHYKLENSVAQIFNVGDWCADIARKQLEDRWRNGGPIKEHESRLLALATIRLERGVVALSRVNKSR